MFSADQIVAHLVGDYLIQSQWMADNKTKSHVAASVHALTYTLPFLLVTRSPIALAIILVTHFFIDRYRLARLVVWAKNWPWPGGLAWAGNTATGYPAAVPAWMSVWLLIIADNVLHILINGAAITLAGSL